jgi:hypothetical protein
MSQAQKRRHEEDVKKTVESLKTFYEKRAVEVMSRLVDKGGFVIKVSEPDLPFMEVELEYLAEELRRHIPTDVIPEISPKLFLNEVADAVRDFVDKFCKRLKGSVMRGWRYREEHGVYSCYHPSTGSFYMVLNDVWDGNYNASEIRFYTTRDLAEAEKEYRKLLEEMEGGEPWLENDTLTSEF